MLRVISVLFVVLLVVCAIAFGDELWLTEQSERGRVVDKKVFDASYAHTNPKRLEKDLIHPKLWKLCAEVEHRIGCFNVSEYEYSNTQQGQRISVTYTVGRFTNDLYIKGLH